MHSKPVKTDNQAFAVKKQAVYCHATTWESGNLTLKSPELPNGLQVRVFKNKIWGRGLLRRWMPLIGGPWGPALRCYLLTKTLFGSLHLRRLGVWEMSLFCMSEISWVLINYWLGRSFWVISTPIPWAQACVFPGWSSHAWGVIRPPVRS